MNYRVHRLEVNEETAQEQLEHFLNRSDGEIISVIPFITPKLKGMGATSVVKFLLIVEKK